MSTYKSIASARAKYNKEHDEKVNANNERLSDDIRYPLRTRICMLLGIDPLIPDDVLYDAIRKVADDSFESSQGIRVDLCQILELDYCIDKDMDIYHAIAMLYAERDTAKKESDLLGTALAYAMPHVHTKNENGHSGVWWRKCQHWQCRQAAALLSAPETWQEVRDEIRPKPAEKISLMPDSEFNTLWELVNKQLASSAQICFYRAETKRRQDAAMSDNSTYGKNELEGKK